MTEDEVVAEFAAKVIAAGLGGAADTLGIGDDAAVVPLRGDLVTSVDVVVEGIHADFSLTSLQDFGWRAVGAALSDLAAMGVSPVGLLSSVISPDFSHFSDLGEGIIASAKQAGCPILGGDVSGGPSWAVSVTVFGETNGSPVIRRSGAQVGDTLVVTGPLGGAARGLELLQQRNGDDLRSADDEVLITRHRRPMPRLREGSVARAVGVHAMCDISDGLGLDLDRLATASRVGVVLHHVPVELGATSQHALGGGDDYELLIATDDVHALVQAFEQEGLRTPIVIGVCVEDQTTREVLGEPLRASGWKH